MKKTRVVYFGYDIETLVLLHRDPSLELVHGVAIDDLLTYTSYNPFDYAFKSAYTLQITQKHSLLKKAWHVLFTLCRCFASLLYKRYAPYLKYSIENNIGLIHQKDLKNTTQPYDLFVVNNWWLLPKSILRIPRYGCVNIHPSKLPQYRGAVPTLWVLKNGDRKSAVSFMILDEGMDSGKVLSQYDFDIDTTDDALSLEKKINAIVSTHLTKDIKAYIAKEQIPQPQDPKNATVTAKYYEYMKILPQNEKAIDVINKVKLYPYLSPTDQCYWITGHKKIPIANAELSKEALLPCQTKLIRRTMHLGCKDGAIQFKLFREVPYLHSITLLKHKTP